MPQPNAHRTGRTAAGEPARAAGAMAELEAGIEGRGAPLALAVLRRCRELVPD
ncbi:hypothetical protein ACWD6N_04520 [Micromonospora sp. NPDC005163]